jgi:hypothetical protein
LLDAIILEKAGIPAIPVVTDAFEPGAREMAELWGAPDFGFVMMPHPLATLTAEDVERRAAGLVDKVLGLLKQGQPV